MCVDMYACNKTKEINIRMERTAINILQTTKNFF